MPTPSSAGSSFEDSEAAHGGADAVPDTPDVPGHGTEPEQLPDGAARALVSGGGPAAAGWTVALFGIVVLAAYIVGVWVR